VKMAGAAAEEAFDKPSPLISIFALFSHIVSLTPGNVLCRGQVHSNLKSVTY
jgi:hypothetical protein